MDYLLVNFGGPRSLEEIRPFLVELLCDRDVIRSRLPGFLHNWLFRRIARKRTLKVSSDYLEIGGKSPIYFDTETLARLLSEKLKRPVATFHRYLPSTHKQSLEAIEKLSSEKICVIPLFPQFSYTTTGSIARFFQKRLSSRTSARLRWIKSYGGHPSFIDAYRKRIIHFLESNSLREEDTLLLFSAHGLPVSYVKSGDMYESECNLSFREVLKGFPNALGKLCYQSKFGKEEWLRPYTDETCENILHFHEGRKNAVIIPIAFTTDHIETLFEIEKLYLPLIAKKGLNAYRCPALNLEPYWIDALLQILQEPNLCGNASLIRA